MSQFDIHEFAEKPITYLLDVQADFLDVLPTRVVVPLAPPEDTGPPAQILHPTVYVDGKPFIALVHLLAAIPARSLGKVAGSVKEQRDEIVRALDFLITG
jgi:toxin CcdB